MYRPLPASAFWTKTKGADDALARLAFKQTRLPLDAADWADAEVYVNDYPVDGRAMRVLHGGAEIVVEPATGREDFVAIAAKLPVTSTVTLIHGNQGLMWERGARVMGASKYDYPSVITWTEDGLHYTVYGRGRSLEQIQKVVDQMN